MKQPRLSLIVPAYNEEKRIRPSLEQIHAYLKNGSYPYELIVVNDGSLDGTASEVKALADAGLPLSLIDRKENRGKGYSVREGAAHARGRIVLFSDADLSTPIEEMEKLLPCLREGFDVAIGSRSLKPSRVIVHQAWYRERMGKIFNFAVQRLVLKGIIDTQCGFKCFTRNAVESIFPLCRIDGFSFDVEILFLARKAGFRVKEVPIRWINSPESTVNPVTDSLRMLKELFQIRRNDRRGIYGGKG